MDAKPRSLKDVFDAQCRYMVPLFQRPYVWNQQDQWEPLWEDISNLAERYYRADAFRPHFMGAVVLEQLNTATGTLDLRQIIDGQQRLTTLQMVIEAACDVCESLGAIASNHVRDLRRLTRNDPRDGNPDETFKVWPTNVDREQFRLVMSAHSPEEVRNHYDGQFIGEVGYAIANGYFFFYDKIKEWLGTDQEIIKKKLDALQNALYRGLLVVVIDLDEKDDAQMIFETLNARGTPLLASDLVKNYLLHRAEDRGYDLDKLYDDHWLFFDSSTFWRQKIQTGRLLRPHIELFMQNYITLLTKDEVLVTNIFNTFRQYVKTHPEVDPINYLKDLHRYGLIYQHFYTTSPETREGLFFKRIQTMDNSTVYPLLMVVYDKLAKPEYEPQRLAILSDLESYLVRRMVCELGTKNYNNIFLDAVKKFIDCSPEQLAPSIRGYLQTLTIDISRWPDNEEFFKAWTSCEVYKRFKPQSRLRMVLEALELQRRTSAKTEDMALPKKKMSIEHILPRGWTDENWRLVGDSEEVKEFRNHILHTLGNLTLVTGSLNSSLSNDPWVKKVLTLQKYSVLLLNVDLKSEPEWNEAAIQKRCKKLFDLAKIVWLYPSANNG